MGPARRCIVVASLLFASLAAADPAGRTPSIGVVFNSVPVKDLVGPKPGSGYARAFVEGLRDRGWVDGRNVKILWRSAEQSEQRRPALISELVHVPVDVMLIGGNTAVRDAVRLTRSIPIVMPTSISPVRDGLVDSLRHPGRNVTGIAVDPGGEVVGKRLALLKQADPRVSRVAFLVYWYLDPEQNAKVEMTPEMIASARALGMELFLQKVDNLEDFDRAVRRGANGLYVGDWNQAYVRENQVKIQRAALRHRLPAIYYAPGSVESGGLMSYTIDLEASYRRAAYFVDRILRGAKASELPIEQPERFELVINLKTAKSMGLAVPAALLAQADRLVE